jgi:WhiB family transcriptional regulator, redox-sensing transcriptional regulator
MPYGWLPWPTGKLDTSCGLKGPEWHGRAACRDVPDPDIFFPDQGGSSKAARSICAECTVLEECLAWALETRPGYGIFANTSERERRALKRARQDEQVAKSRGSPTSVQQMCSKRREKASKPVHDKNRL